MMWKKKVLVLGCALLCTSLLMASSQPVLTATKPAKVDNAPADRAAGDVKILEPANAALSTNNLLDAAKASQTPAKSGPGGPVGAPRAPDFTVTAPGTWAGDTCGAIDDCAVRTTEDHVYQVTLPNDGTWVFSLCGSAYDTYLAVGTTECGTDVGLNDDSCGLQSEITAPLTAGIYFVAVEGYSGCGAYTLDISKTGAGGCPGDLCANALPVASLPFSDIGNTCSCANDYQAPNPSIDCGFSSSTLAPDLVYSYTPAASGCVDISLCGSSYDTALQVYAGDCLGTSLIACNDDSCSFQSEILGLALTGGTTYFIVVDGYGTSCGDYALNITACGVAPTGACCMPDGSCTDGMIAADCAAAGGTYQGDGSTCAGVVCGSCTSDFTVAAPGSWTGTTCGAIDDCAVRTTEDHVYQITLPNDGLWTFSLCSSLYDTYLAVGTTCCGTEVGANDDSCGLQSSITATLTAGTYYVAVEGFSGCGDYTLDVSKQVACNVTCPPGANIEGETCGADTNGGCNAVPTAYEPIACGETVCGTAWADLGTRDTDWYAFTIATDSIVAWTVASDFPAAVFILDIPLPDCSTINLAASAYPAADCTAVSAVSACLAPGTYYLFVATGDSAGAIYDGYPCTNEYVGTLTCTTCTAPTGACCFTDGTCADGQTSAACAAAGGTYQGDGSICSGVICPIVSANDDCPNAISVAVPSVTPGTTDLATIDSGAPSCGSASVTSPGVWYKLIGTGNTLTADLCNGTATYDSKLSVFCGTCLAPACVDGNDDFCGLQSSVTWCSQLGIEYLILVHGFGGATGPFDLTITEGLACSTPPPCATGACCFADGSCSDGMTSTNCAAASGTYQGDGSTCAGVTCLACDVVCPPGATPENEPNCGLPADTVNGGCNSTPNVFSAIACGETVCGTAAFDGTTRDTDWYAVTVATDTIFTWTVESEFDALIGLVETVPAGSGNCADSTGSLNPFANIAPCTPTSVVTACLPPGTYWFFVAPQFTNLVTCGAQYSATLTCVTCTPPTGACCFPDGTCTDAMSAGGCAAAGGTYQGDSSICAGVICPVAPDNDDCANATCIADGDVVLGSTALATSDGVTASCGASSSCPDVWYAYTPVTTELVSMSLCGSAYDTAMQVFDACGGTELACNDDFCGLQSQIDMTLTAGTTYLIRIAGYSCSTGDYTLTITGGGGTCGCGDLDNDGFVNINDYWAFVDAFGTCIGDVKYNPKADFDGDGCITLLDYQAWIKCYRAAGGVGNLPPPGPNHPRPKLSIAAEPGGPAPMSR